MEDSATLDGILQDQGLRARALYDYQAGKIVTVLFLSFKSAIKFILILILNDSIGFN